MQLCSWMIACNCAVIQRPLRTVSARPGINSDLSLRTFVRAFGTYLMREPINVNEANQVDEGANQADEGPIKLMRGPMKLMRGLINQTVNEANQTGHQGRGERRLRREAL